MNTLASVKPIPQEHMAKTFIATFEDGTQKKIRAISYCLTYYNFFAFYMENSEQVHKANNKSAPLVPVSEFPRKDVKNISLEGVSEQIDPPKPKRTKTLKSRRSSTPAKGKAVKSRARGN